MHQRKTNTKRVEFMGFLPPPSDKTATIHDVL